MARARKRSSPLEQARRDDAPTEQGESKHVKPGNGAPISGLPEIGTIDAQVMQARPADASASHEPHAVTEIPGDVLGQQNLLAAAFAAPGDAVAPQAVRAPDAPMIADMIADAAAPAPAALPGETPASAPPAPDTISDLPRPKTSLDSLLKRNPGLLRRRIVKAALGLAITVAVGWLPAQRFLELASAEAVVNARLVTVRAPIDGQIEPASALPEIGSPVAAHAVLLRVVNPRADRGRLDDVRRLSDAVASERAGIVARLALLRAQHAALADQTRYFQEARVRELEAQAGGMESEIAAATATRVEADATLARTAALAQSGAQTRVALDRAQRDDRVAAQAETTLRRRLTAVQIELEAARQGKFVGDSYNDRPSSSAHADEVALRIAELEADLRIRDERLARLAASEREEAARYAQASAAALAAPVSGNLWEMLTTPGEDVRAGREVLRILDCSHMLVTAVVSEKTYASLRLGSPARFRPLGESTDYAGRVIQLTGLAAPPDNLAIGTAALTRDTYRVIVSVPALETSGCAVGRSGRVTFMPKDPAAEVAAQPPAPQRISRQ
ncbi:MAG TPA: HlyD family efflux transporter periplasmic adaptor subunit [Xanthobacteraceae bacterium]|nr:HlyD family efflux transporter periplasmic adaptor subunit [Xanthobacteraceae bacterium]